MVSLFIDIREPFFYIAMPYLQLPMVSLGPNDILIMTGFQGLIPVLRRLFLWLKDVETMLNAVQCFILSIVWLFNISKMELLNKR